MKAALAQNLILPWSASIADEKRFRRIVAICVILALAISLTLPLIILPEPDRLQVEKIPPRLAKLLLEKKKVEPPKVEAPKPPKPEKPKLEEKKPEPKPKPKPEKKPEPKPKPKPEAKPEPKPKPKRDVAEIRKKVSNAGVLAMQDMLADLRESQPIETLKSTKPLQTAGTTERAMAPSILTAKASKGSGGIDTSKFNRSASDNELAGRELSTVTSEIAEIEVATGPANESRGRSEDEIARIMRANYNVIYSIYQRELRKNPLLSGKVIFRLIIEPDGSVSDCQVIDSELGNPKLERKLALRIKRINFGAKDVETTTIDFPIAFLPG